MGQEDRRLPWWAVADWDRNSWRIATKELSHCLSIHSSCFLSCLSARSLSFNITCYLKETLLTFVTTFVSVTVNYRITCLLCHIMFWSISSSVMGSWLYLKRIFILLIYGGKISFETAFFLSFSLIHHVVFSTVFDFLNRETLKIHNEVLKHNRRWSSYALVCHCFTSGSGTSW